MDGVKTDVNSSKTKIASLESKTKNSLDTGAIYALGFGYNKQISGALPCTWGHYLQSAYPDLFSRIGYSYGITANGSTTIYFEDFSITSSLIYICFDRTTGDMYQIRMVRPQLYVIKYTPDGVIDDYYAVPTSLINYVNGCQIKTAKALNGSLAIHVYLYNNGWGDNKVLFSDNGSWKPTGATSSSYILECSSFLCVFVPSYSSGVLTSMGVRILSNARQYSKNIAVADLESSTTATKNIHYFGGDGNACYITGSKAMFRITFSGSAVVTTTCNPNATFSDTSDLVQGLYFTKNGLEYLLFNGDVLSRSPSSASAFSPVSDSLTFEEFPVYEFTAYTLFTHNFIKLSNNAILTEVEMRYRQSSSSNIYTTNLLCVLAFEDGLVTYCASLDSQTKNKDYAMINGYLLVNDSKYNMVQNLLFHTPKSENIMSREYILT